MTGRGNALTVEQLHARRRYKDRVRAAALLDLSEGRVSVADVLARAVLPEGTSLLKVTIQQLLVHLPDVGPSTAHTVQDRMARFLGPQAAVPDRRHQTIRWLLDGHTNGLRVVALADAVAATAPQIRFDSPGGRRPPRTGQGRPFLPWAGFPFAPPPASVTLRLADRIERPDRVFLGGDPSA